MQSSTQEQAVAIPCGAVHLDGVFALPSEPTGIVLFSHGSGSSRLSPRNTYVARDLREAGIGTLLLDLLTPLEDIDPNSRFDIALLTQRLQCAADWLRTQTATASLPIGLFGASTGAAAALRLSAREDAGVDALVLRGGRTDLATPLELASVSAPTLLIVGALDDLVLTINRVSYTALKCKKRIEVIDGATHLFEEAGKLDEVAVLARHWFALHLTQPARHPARSVRAVHGPTA
ncbi:MAG: alpha/beta hydrolase [Pseudomonadota bacterium]